MGLGLGLGVGVALTLTLTRAHLVRGVARVVVEVGDVPSPRGGVTREHEARGHLGARKQRGLLGGGTVLTPARDEHVRDLEQPLRREAERAWSGSGLA